MLSAPLELLNSMAERIVRETDERRYQPAIHSDRIRELYRIKMMTGIPMTVLVDTALRQFIAFYVNESGYKALEPEDAKMEATLNMGDRQEQDLINQEFNETDKREDGSLYGF